MQCSTLSIYLGLLRTDKNCCTINSIREWRQRSEWRQWWQWRHCVKGDVNRWLDDNEFHDGRESRHVAAAEEQKYTSPFLVLHRRKPQTHSMEYRRGTGKTSYLSDWHSCEWPTGETTYLNDWHWMIAIGVWAQSTWGDKTFLPENRYMNSYQNSIILHRICPKNARILHDRSNCPKNIFRIFFLGGGGGTCLRLLLLWYLAGKSTLLV